MSERYIATSASGAHVVRTNSHQTATESAVLMRGQVIDTKDN